LTTTVGFDTTQPSSIRAYFAAIFFTPSPNPSITTEADDSILVYKGAHCHSPEEAISSLLSHLRIEVGAKARETLARRKPGIGRESWKGLHDLSAAVRQERADASTNGAAGVASGTYPGHTGTVGASERLETRAERLTLQEIGRPPSYGA